MRRREQTVWQNGQRVMPARELDADARGCLWQILFALWRIECGEPSLEEQAAAEERELLRDAEIVGAQLRSVPMGGSRPNVRRRDGVERPALARIEEEAAA